MRIEFPESAKPWRRSTAITGREVKVLELAAMGYTDSRIKTELGVGNNTLATTWRRILSKVSASSRQEAVSKFAERSPAPQQQTAIALPPDCPDFELSESELLIAITDASLCYINGRQNVRQVYSRMLDDLLRITKSQYGLIGEVHQEAGIPYLGEHALTSLAWDDKSQAKYEMQHKDHLLFRNLDGLFGETIKSRDTLIVNNARHDSRSGSTPSGHPEIRSFMGLPVYNGLDLIGVIGLANRPDGYHPAIAAFLKPLASTCANVTAAWRLEKRRRVVERGLDESKCIMRTLVERTPAAVLYENADRRLEFVNDRFGDLFGIEAAPGQLVGIDTSLIFRHSTRLFVDPLRFQERVEDLIAGQESYYGELVEMVDGRLFLRDFVVVRSSTALCGYFWHYRQV